MSCEVIVEHLGVHPFLLEANFQSCSRPHLDCFVPLPGRARARKELSFSLPLPPALYVAGTAGTDY